MKPGIRWLLFLVIGGCLIGSTLSAAAASPSSATQWDQAKKIAGEQGTPAWFADVALDSSGTAHVVWHASRRKNASAQQTAQPSTTSESGALSNGDEDLANIQDYLMYQNFNGESASAVTDIALAHNGEAVRNGIIVDQDGYLDIVYRSGQRIWFKRAPINAAPRASGWSEAQRISGSDQSYYTTIAQDASGTLHVVYTENAAIDTTDHNAVKRQSLFYRRSTDHGATWSSAIRLSSSSILFGTTRPQIRTYGTTVAVAWDQGYDNISSTSDPYEAGFRRSTDSGKTWQPVQTITDPDGPIEQCTFAFDTSKGTDPGTAHAVLVWRETKNTLVRYSRSTDGGATWSAPDTIPNLVARPYLLKHQFDRYALVGDNTGTFHLLAVGQLGQPDQLALMHLELRQDGQWTAPQPVYKDGGLPEYPAIATDGGNRLFVTFFVRDSLFSVGAYRVWSVEGHMASTPVTPHAVPTVAPTATPHPRMLIAASPQPPTVFPPIGVMTSDDRESIDRPPGVVSIGGGIFVAFGVTLSLALGKLWLMRRP